MSTRNEFYSVKDIAAFAVINGVPKLGVGSYYTSQERCGPNDTETMYHYRFKENGTEKEIETVWFPSRAEAVANYNKGIDAEIAGSILELRRLEKQVEIIKGYLLEAETQKIN